MLGKLSCFKYCDGNFQIVNGSLKICLYCSLCWNEFCNYILRGVNKTLSGCKIHNLIYSIRGAATVKEISAEKTLFLVYLKNQYEDEIVNFHVPYLLIATYFYCYSEMSQINSDSAHLDKTFFVDFETPSKKQVFCRTVRDSKMISYCESLRTLLSFPPRWCVILLRMFGLCACQYHMPAVSSVRIIGGQVQLSVS